MMPSVTAIRIESCFVNVNMSNSIEIRVVQTFGSRGRVRVDAARRAARSLAARSRDIKRQSLNFGPP
jgi:hypothetical protein